MQMAVSGPQCSPRQACEFDGRSLCSCSTGQTCQVNGGALASIGYCQQGGGNRQNHNQRGNINMHRHSHSSRHSRVSIPNSLFIRSDSYESYTVLARINPVFATWRVCKTRPDALCFPRIRRKMVLPLWLGILILNAHKGNMVALFTDKKPFRADMHSWPDLFKQWKSHMHLSIGYLYTYRVFQLWLLHL